MKSTFSQFTGHCEFTEGRIIYLQLPPTADWSLIQCQLDYSFINHPITCTCALLINSFFQPVLLRFSQLLKATITFNSLNIKENTKLKLCLWNSFINLQIQVGLHHHYNFFLIYFYYVCNDAVIISFNFLSKTFPNYWNTVYFILLSIKFIYYFNDN